MNSKLRIFAVIMAVVIFSGILVYIPLTRATQSTGSNQEASANCNETDDWHLLWWLLNNSEPVKVEGEAMTFYKDMLVVDTDEDQVRIALPEEWIVGRDIVMREELFEIGFLSSGENVTIDALRTDLIGKEGFSIYFLIGYEIVNSTGICAHATMPLNIETDL